MRLHTLQPDEMWAPMGQVSVGERMYLQTSIFDAVSKVFDLQMDSITDMNQWLINATKTVSAAIAAGSSPAMYKEDFIDIDAMSAETGKETCIGIIGASGVPRNWAKGRPTETFSVQ